MKPWMGALAVAAGLAVLPSTALADGPVSLFEFKVPDRAAIDQLNNMGVDVTENVRPDANRGGLIVQIAADESEKARLEAMGYPRCARSSTSRTRRRSRQSARPRSPMTRQPPPTPRPAARSHGAQVAPPPTSSRPSAPTTSRTTPAASCRSRACPPTAHGNGASGSASTPARRMSAVLDSARAPWPTPADDPAVGLRRRRRLPVPLRLVRVGDENDGGRCPSSVRVASANGGVDTIAVKQWIEQGRQRASRPASCRTSTRTTWTRRRLTRQMRALQAEFPNISDIIELPNKTAGYQRLSQAIVGTADAVQPDADVADQRGHVATADQPKAVVLTSKRMRPDRRQRHLDPRSTTRAARSTGAVGHRHR